MSNIVQYIFVEHTFRGTINDFEENKYLLKVKDHWAALCKIIKNRHIMCAVHTFWSMINIFEMIQNVDPVIGSLGILREAWRATITLLNTKCAWQMGDHIFFHQQTIPGVVLHLTNKKKKKDCIVVASLHSCVVCPRKLFVWNETIFHFSRSNGVITPNYFMWWDERRGKGNEENNKSCMKFCRQKRRKTNSTRYVVTLQKKGRMPQISSRPQQRCRPQTLCWWK